LSVGDGAAAAEGAAKNIIERLQVEVQILTVTQVGDWLACGRAERIVCFIIGVCVYETV
jgi:hypothetical protein